MGCEILVRAICVIKRSSRHKREAKIGDSPVKAGALTSYVTLHDKHHIP
jgi:hypothetical protein